MRENPALTTRARTLRKRLTDAEKRLWWALREGLPGFHFRRQVPFGSYIADFCCHGAKLIVEADGGQHDEDVDARRTAFLEREGYRVLRFWNTDILARTADVIETIWRALEGLHPHLTSPLKGEGQGGVTALGSSQ